MSQRRLSPIATRSSATASAGEKASPQPDAIVEEDVQASKEEKRGMHEAKQGWLSYLALDITKSEWEVLIASTCLKLLLFPA